MRSSLATCPFSLVSSRCQNVKLEKEKKLATQSKMLLGWKGPFNRNLIFQKNKGATMITWPIQLIAADLPCSAALFKSAQLIKTSLSGRFTSSGFPTLKPALRFAARTQYLRRGPEDSLRITTGAVSASHLTCGLSRGHTRTPPKRADRRRKIWVGTAAASRQRLIWSPLPAVWLLFTDKLLLRRCVRGSTWCFPSAGNCESVERACGSTRASLITAPTATAH